MITIDDSDTLYRVIDYHVMSRGFKDLQHEALLYIIEHCADLYRALEAMPEKGEGKLYDTYQKVAKLEERWLDRLGDWRLAEGTTEAGYDQAKKMIAALQA